MYHEIFFLILVLKGIYHEMCFPPVALQRESITMFFPSVGFKGNLSRNTFSSCWFHRESITQHVFLLLVLRGVCHEIFFPPAGFKGNISRLMFFPPVGFKGNLSRCLFLLLVLKGIYHFFLFFSPVGFKGTRCHYWTASFFFLSRRLKQMEVDALKS